MIDRMDFALLQYLSIVRVSVAALLDTYDVAAEPSQFWRAQFWPGLGDFQDLMRMLKQI